MLKKSLVAGALIVGLVVPTIVIAAPGKAVPSNSVVSQSAEVISKAAKVLSGEKENKVAMGDEFTIQLDLDKNYRYEYIINQPMDTSALISPVGDGVLNNDKQTWNFKAENLGKATISIYLYEEGNEAPVDSIDYDIEIVDELAIEITEEMSEVNVGDKFSFTLSANPSTGYRYEVVVHQPMDTASLVELESEGFAEIPEGMVGTPTEKTWVYSAEKEGTVYFDFHLYAPGDATEPEETVSFCVNIK